MIIKIRNKSFLTSHEKHIFAPKNNLEHICAHKSLLSIYIIYNYIIYRFVFPCPTFYRFYVFPYPCRISVSTTWARN